MSFKKFFESKNVTDDFGTAVYTGGFEHHDPNEYGTVVDTSNSGHAHSKRHPVDEYGTVVDTSNSGHAHSKIKESLNEAHKNYNYFSENDNDHLGSNKDEIQKHLHKIYDRVKSHPSWPAMSRYTSSSHDLNKYLVNRHNDPKEQFFNMKHASQAVELDKLMKEHKNPFYLDVYHGATFHPGEEASKHPENRLFMPAYTSTSISKYTARGFGNGKHLIHFHLEPGAQGTFVGKHSNHPGEGEYVLPRNVSWKLHPEPTETETGHTIWHAYDMQHHDINSNDEKEIKRMQKEKEKDPLTYDVKYHPKDVLDKLEMGHSLPLTKEHIKMLEPHANLDYHQTALMKHPNYDKSEIYKKIESAKDSYAQQHALNHASKIDPEYVKNFALKHFASPDKNDLYTKISDSYDKKEYNKNMMDALIKALSNKYISLGDLDYEKHFKDFVKNGHEGVMPTLLAHGNPGAVKDALVKALSKDASKHDITNVDNMHHSTVQQYMHDNNIDPESLSDKHTQYSYVFKNLKDKAMHQNMLNAPRDADGIHPMVKKMMNDLNRDNAYQTLHDIHKKFTASDDYPDKLKITGHELSYILDHLNNTVKDHMPHQEYQSDDIANRISQFPDNFSKIFDDSHAEKAKKYIDAHAKHHETSLDYYKHIINDHLHDMKYDNATPEEKGDLLAKRYLTDYKDSTWGIEDSMVMNHSLKNDKNDSMKTWKHIIEKHLSNMYENTPEKNRPNFVKQTLSKILVTIGEHNYYHKLDKHKAVDDILRHIKTHVSNNELKKALAAAFEKDKKWL